MALLESARSNSRATDTELRDRWRTTVGLICPTVLPDNSDDTASPVNGAESAASLASPRRITVGQ